MNCINSIRRANIQREADIENSQLATYAIKRCGGVLLRAGNQTKNLEGDEASSFISKIRDKGTGYVKVLVREYFTPAVV